ISGCAFSAHQALSPGTWASHPAGLVRGGLLPTPLRQGGHVLSFHLLLPATVELPSPPAGGNSPADLSPMGRIFPSRSDIFMPERASNSAGTCAAISVMSPVILCMPAEEPLPVETMVILSTLFSGLDSAFTTSGKPVMSLSYTAAWLYSW